MIVRGWFLALIIFLFVGMTDYAYAALYIDDTSTIDKGHFEAEFSWDYYRDMEKEFNPDSEEYDKYVSKETYITSVVSYGLTERWDMGVTTPYKFLDDSSTGEHNGISDIIFSSKYRFLEEKKFFPSYAFSFDFKASNANQEKYLGSGEKEYTLNNIFTKYIGKNVIDLNLGYTFIANKETDDIFFYSFDLERDFTQNFSACSEIYGESDFKNGSDKNVFCWALSFDYQLTKIICLEAGVGIGISKASPDYQYSSTITFSF